MAGLGGAILGVFFALVIGLLWGINRLVSKSAKATAIRLAKRNAEKLKNAPFVPEEERKRRAAKRNRIMLIAAVSSVVLIGIFSFIEKNDEKKCSMDFKVVNQDNKNLVFFGNKELFKTDSSSIKTDSYYGEFRNIALIVETFSNIGKDGTVSDPARKYRIIYKDNDCAFHATPLFGNSHEPVISYDDGHLYLYFKPGDDGLYPTTIESDRVYGAGAYKVGFSPWRFDTIAIDPKLDAALASFGDALE